MTDNRDQFKDKSTKAGPPGELERDGRDKTIVCDTATLAHADDAFVDFLIQADQRGYRVVLQSKNPGKDMDGFLADKARASTIFKTFLGARPTSRPVLLQGSPEVNRGQEPYLRITFDRNFKVNEWAPHDRRIGLTTYLWAQGPQPTLEQVRAHEEYAKRRLSEITADSRRHSMVVRTKLIDELTAQGIDPVQFFQNIEDRNNAARGLGPSKPKV